MNGTDANTNGTIAAVVPIAVPTKNLVKGMIATINMMNGIDLIAFTIDPMIRFNEGLDRICPSLVTCSSTPNGTPNAVAIAIDTTTMYTVSPNAFVSSGKLSIIRSNSSHTRHTNA